MDREDIGAEWILSTSQQTLRKLTLQVSEQEHFLGEGTACLLCLCKRAEQKHRHKRANIGEKLKGFVGHGRGVFGDVGFYRSVGYVTSHTLKPGVWWHIERRCSWVMDRPDFGVRLGGALGAWHLSVISHAASIIQSSRFKRESHFLLAGLSNQWPWAVSLQYRYECDPQGKSWQKIMRFPLMTMFCNLTVVLEHSPFRC